MHRLVPLDATGDDSFVDRLTAIWSEGDAALPVDPRLPAPARDSLIASMDIERPVDDGDALVVPTSGSTGTPKGVVLTHDAVDASARATSNFLEVDPQTDRWLACLPLAHIGGLAVVCRALATGTPVTVHPGFDPSAVDGAGATLVSLVPTALRRIDPARFRWIVLGGSAPPADRPANVVATYGMTETGSGVVYDGLPLHGVEVRVVGGELHVRGPMLLRCYRDGTDPKDADGWLPTGDLGAVGEDGRVSVSGRAGDLIISGGENVWPEPIERRLLEYPAVADVAIVGRPDPEWGQRVVALVVPAADARVTLDELRNWVRESMPAWCAPKELELRDALPRTALGKLQRAGLD